MDETGILGLLIGRHISVVTSLFASCYGEIGKTGCVNSCPTSSGFAMSWLITLQMCFYFDIFHESKTSSRECKDSFFFYFSISITLFLNYTPKCKKILQGDWNPVFKCLSNKLETAKLCLMETRQFPYMANMFLCSDGVVFQENWKRHIFIHIRIYRPHGALCVNGVDWGVFR